MHFEAPIAELDQEAKQLVMGDGVTILTSTGYRIEAETFYFDLGSNQRCQCR